MSSQQQMNVDLPDPKEVAKSVSEIAAQSQELVRNFLKQLEKGPQAGEGMESVGQAFIELTTRMMMDPTYVMKANMQLWQDYVGLWQESAMAWLGGKGSGKAVADRRFRDDQWSENAVFDFIKQAYLLNSQWAMNLVNGVDGLDEHQARLVDFYTRQYVDALSPTNFVLTNPEVLRETVDSGGKNLLNGLKNMLKDMSEGNGQLKIRMTDTEAFELGKNVATTPGKVVFQNALMQLVQYTPSTEEVYKRPLLVVPPWINKFYILDLQPKNSFIKWAVDQGHTVFVISWVNPDESLADKGFEDYMLDGPLAALDAIEQATGESEVNAVGYCLGGTLLGSTLAYSAAKGDNRIKSATCFTTMLDFAHPGELGVFIDEQQLESLEEKMQQRGYLCGSEMASTFNMLRANDLIWSFYINNYLMGKEPRPFDLLYWNSDSTRMPAKMHSFYLRNMYLENRLREPGGVTLAGEPIDLRKIETPMYFISAVEDHIAPWKSTYAGALLPKGKVRFILGGSGHIAGVINPPEKKKYGYWTNDNLVETADEWFEGATQHEGSWWGDWNTWIKRRAGKKVPARVPGDGKLAVLEDAPGSYVKAKA